MARRATPAQVGGGDPNVIAGPGFRDIPKCLFPLRSKEAKREYDDLARALFDSGHMTLAKHRALSSYASQFDTITLAGLAGKQARGSWYMQLERSRKALGLDAIDTPVATPTDAANNRFARVGFASRRR